MSSSPDLTASRRSSRYLLVVTSRTISSASLLPMPKSTLRAPAEDLSSAENSPDSVPWVTKLRKRVFASPLLSSKEEPASVTT